LEIAGVKMDGQPPLDGVSLVPLLESRMESRPRGMGFWHYPSKGIGTPSHKWMSQLLEEQEAGREPNDPGTLRLEAGKIDKRYPTDKFPGHAAWIEGDWKLHRRGAVGKKKGNQ